MKTTFLNPDPKPGGGAYLVKMSRSKRLRRVKQHQAYQVSLLKANDSEYVADNETGPESGPKLESFLRPCSQPKREPSSSAQTLHDDDPRTIEIPKLLLPTALEQHQPPPLTSRSCLPIPNTNLPLTNSAPSTKSNHSIVPADERVVIPPHLRPKQAPSTLQASTQTPTCDADHGNAHTRNDNMPAKKAPEKAVKSIATEANIRQTSVLPTPSPTNTHADYIREKLQDFGCKVEDPKPADTSKSPAATYPSPVEDKKVDANSDASQAPIQTFRTTKRGGKSSTIKRFTEESTKNTDARPSARGRGRGNGYRGRGDTGGPRTAYQPRTSDWPSNKEMAADPHRWDTNWEETLVPGRSDSARNDSGFGSNGKKQRKDIDPDTGFKLTGWDGDWAPAPINWDARPAFRDNQSAAQIERWMDVIENELGGINMAVSKEEIIGARELCSEVAPRYWIPIVKGTETLQAFWSGLLNLSGVTLIDEDDLDGAIPWWQLYECNKESTLEPRAHPEISGVDPDETEHERLTRENDEGSNYHTANRKRLERAKIEAERKKRTRVQEKAQKISKRTNNGEDRKPIKPGLKIYLRSAKPSDAKAIRDIYNHYVSYTVYTPEIQKRTTADIEQRYNDIVRNKLPFLVACKRGDVHKPRRGKKKNADVEPIVLPDEVIGFAFADDYNDMLSMYRFTAEIEVWVHEDHYMKGIGTCLLDKLMAMLDPEYLERGGYDTEGEELEGVGPMRIIQIIMINLPYESDKPARLEWVGKWLTSWLGFEQEANMRHVGMKNGKNVNLAIFKRTTGANIDAANPPIMMAYPK